MSTPKNAQPHFPTDQEHHPAWRFPSPSSRGHAKCDERPKIQHSRSVTAGRAPTLTTALRADRRAYNRSLTSQPSPPLSEYSRSPLSRVSSSSTGAMSSTKGAPHTPARKHARHSSFLQNSPFSDYFTDDSRSVDSASTHSNVPSTETKPLLVRMNKLQSQLMRDRSGCNREAISIVNKKLSEIELELSTLQAQTRQSTYVDDSGVFMDDDEDDHKAAMPHSRQVSMQSSYAYGFDSAMDLPAQPVTLEQYKQEREWFVLRMQDLVDGLSTAGSELQRRYAEVQELNERHNAEMEEREMQLEQLRSENEGLRSDLGFEYSELLFLKLQMKSIECDVDAISDDSDFASLQPWTQHTRREKKNCILAEVDRWRSDWQDVNSRFKRRRSKYGVTPDRRDSVSTGSVVSSNGEADWHLETVKEVLGGRVTSLTITRTASASENAISENPGDASSSPDVTNNAHTEQSFLRKTLDLEGHQNKQGDSEPQIAEKNYVYTEHGSQTEIEESQDEEQEDVEEEEEDEDEDEEDFVEDSEGEEEIEHGEEEDCAITTSSEDIHDVEEDEEVEIKEPITSTRPKTAWQELWSSLQNLSGLGDEEEEVEY